MTIINHPFGSSLIAPKMFDKTAHLDFVYCETCFICTHKTSTIFMAVTGCLWECQRRNWPLLSGDFSAIYRLISIILPSWKGNAVHFTMHNFYLNEKLRDILAVETDFDEYWWSSLILHWEKVKRSISEEKHQMHHKVPFLFLSYGVNLVENSWKMAGFSHHFAWFVFCSQCMQCNGRVLD